MSQLRALVKCLEVKHLLGQPQHREMQGYGKGTKTPVQREIAKVHRPGLKRGCDTSLEGLRVSGVTLGVVEAVPLGKGGQHTDEQREATLLSNNRKTHG